MHDSVVFIPVRQAVQSIAGGRALVAESWFLFVCLFVLWCCLILDHLVSSLFNPSPSVSSPLLSPLFWLCVTASPHLRELSKSSVFVFRCLPRNVFLSSPAHKLICIQTHTYTWTYRESSSKITENLDYTLFFPSPSPMMNPPVSSSYHCLCSPRS